MSPTISVKNLRKYYSAHQKEAGLKGTLKSLFNRQYIEIKAVEDISFEIEEAELIGFIGPNGAGKTTTLKVLSGLLYPTSGQVAVLGYQPYQRNPKFQKQFALVMGQKNQLWWDLPSIDTFNLNKAIYEVSDSEFKKTLSELSELLDVKEILNIPVKKSSLGQRMKMELIAALIHSPKILFLDEPTIGLDVSMQKKMREFIKDYNQLKKSTIILTSHYMQDIKELAKRVIIIDHGKILFDGKLSEIINKFASYKTISLTLGKEVKREELSKYGKVLESDETRAVLSIKRADVSRMASVILEKLPVEDLNIEEAQIEDIIREVFTSNKITNYKLQMTNDKIQTSTKLQI